MNLLLAKPLRHNTKSSEAEERETLDAHDYRPPPGENQIHAYLILSNHSQGIYVDAVRLQHESSQGV